MFEFRANSRNRKHRTIVCQLWSKSVRGNWSGYSIHFGYIHRPYGVHFLSMLTCPSPYWKRRTLKRYLTHQYNAHLVRPHASCSRLAKFREYLRPLNTHRSILLASHDNTSSFLSISSPALSSNMPNLFYQVSLCTFATGNSPSRPQPCTTPVNISLLREYLMEAEVL